MRALGIITGILLMFVVSPINEFAGYGYTFGGAFETLVTSDWDAIALQPSGDGDTLSTIQTLASTKLGLFGLLLQVLAAVQFVAGFLLIIKERTGLIFLSFLIIVALYGISAEIVGSVFTSSFGPINTIGTVISMFVLIISVSMFLKTRKMKAATSK